MYIKTFWASQKNLLGIIALLLPTLLARRNMFILYQQKHLLVAKMQVVRGYTTVSHNIRMSTIIFTRNTNKSRKIKYGMSFPQKINL